MGPTPQAGRSLAYWLRTQAPALYAAMQRKAAQAQTRAAMTGRLSGLGACSCHVPRGTLGRLGQDDADLPSITVTADNFGDDAGVSYGGSPFTFDAVDPSTFAPIAVDETALNASPVDLTASAASDLTPQATPSSPGVLAAVGNYLTSTAGLNSLLQVGTAVLNNQTSKNVLATQVARVAAGGNPAAISYAVNPATGQVTPVMAGVGGPYPVTQPLLNSLAPNASALQLGNFLSQNGLLVAGALALLLLVRR